MAWKNLKQRSLGDALLIDHEALQELDGVHGFIRRQLTCPVDDNYVVRLI